MSPKYALALGLALSLSAAAPARAEISGAEFGYDPDQGAFIRTRDHAWELNPYAMVQLQHVSLFAKEGTDTTFSLRSAKLILHGHIFHPSITYHFQINAGNGAVAAEDVYVRWDPDRAFGILAGQIEVPFNRQHITLEAYQQLIDRSIVNQRFTLQRDIGAALYAGDRPHVFEAVLGVWNGARQNAPNDDKTYMGSLRLAWNPFGPIPFREADIAHTPSPKLSIAAAVAYNPARVVADPTGVSPPATWRHVTQAVGETTFRWRGVSLSIEGHVRRLDVAGAGRLDFGAFGQAGVFVIPRHLEIEGRFGAIDGKLQPNDAARELTFGASYYFRGHRLKLQADGSHLVRAGGAIDRRVRTQLGVFF